MVGDILSQTGDARGEVLIPQSERADDEVVEAAYQAGEQEGLGLAAALRARHQHLRGGRGLGEGILAVHVLDEILAEGDEEEDAQHAAEGRGKEYLEETGLEVEHVDGGQNEDGSRHDSARAGTDALDDDILAHGVPAMGGLLQTYGNDGDRDGGLKHLTHLQAQIGGGGRKQHHHDESPAHGPGSDLWINFVGPHDGLVLLAGLQLPERVVRQP